MPRQRYLRAAATPSLDTVVRMPSRPPVPVPALLRDVDLDAAAILTEAVGRVPGDPACAVPSEVPDQPSRHTAEVGAVPAGRARLSVAPDAGMNTAEYAVGTLAAVAFAGLLLKVLTSDSVQAALAGVIQRALG
ncbi:DUF4244 domain-containing protein [Catellatospora methionotrophica]|uniref:DUF4244 domain-containing protein n=1 Tax=Catellatospora methionotrophica TaxID=121620 RepID=UPI003F4D1CD9